MDRVSKSASSSAHHSHHRNDNEFEGTEDSILGELDMSFGNAHQRGRGKAP